VPNYWLSWEHREEYGEFELHSPWWVSGIACYADGAEVETVCAAIRANSGAAAKDAVLSCYDVTPDRETVVFRFVEERPEGWNPFSGRFPADDWMRWPPADIHANAVEGAEAR
jgi:hypothetical protein